MTVKVTAPVGIAKQKESEVLFRPNTRMCWICELEGEVSSRAIAMRGKGDEKTVTPSTIRVELMRRGGERIMGNRLAPRHMPSWQLAGK